MGQEKIKPLKVSYSMFAGEAFSMLIQKIGNTPNTSNIRAAHIHHILKQLEAGRKVMIAEYHSDLEGKYAKKDDKGAIVRPEEDPIGFVPMEGKEDEFAKAQEEFYKREFEVVWKPWTLDTLADIKLSGRDIGLLGELITLEPEKGPQLPEELMNQVSQLSRQQKRAMAQANN